MNTVTQTDNTIKIFQTNNYGTEAIYPACDVSRKLLELTGRKTFSRQDLKTIRDLGYNAVRVLDRN